MMRPRLIIFAKAPLMGQAKTRLAADIGPVHAQRLFRAMTVKIIRSVKGPKWDTVLAVTPPAFLGHIPEWADTPQYAQTSGSLSPRLMQAFQRNGPTVVIGTDSPQIHRNDIDAAFKALRSHDTVFGPASDGGFWLMGLKKPAKPGLFEAVNWSTETALADVSRNLSGSTTYLQTLTDVDDEEALRVIRRDVRF